MIIIFNMMMQFLLLGLVSPVVAQLEQAPMMRPRIRPLLRVLWLRARATLWVILRLVALPLPLTLLGALVMAKGINMKAAGATLEEYRFFILLGRPFYGAGMAWLIYVLARYWVALPVVFMEGLVGKAAIARARALTRGGFTALLSVVLVRQAINFIETRTLVETGSPYADATISLVLGLPLEVTLAILMALVYFKFRQARGETMQTILATYRATMPAREPSAQPSSSL